MTSNGPTPPEDRERGKVGLGDGKWNSIGVVEAPSTDVVWQLGPADYRLVFRDAEFLDGRTVLEARWGGSAAILTPGHEGRLRLLGPPKSVISVAAIVGELHIPLDALPVSDSGVTSDVEIRLPARPPVVTIEVDVRATDGSQISTAEISIRDMKGAVVSRSRQEGANGSYVVNAPLDTELWLEFSPMGGMFEKELYWVPIQRHVDMKAGREVRLSVIARTGGRIRVVVLSGVQASACKVAVSAGGSNQIPLAVRCTDAPGGGAGDGLGEIVTAAFAEGVYRLVIERSDGLAWQRDVFVRDRQTTEVYPQW